MNDQQIARETHNLVRSLIESTRSVRAEDLADREKARNEVNNAITALKNEVSTATKKFDEFCTNYEPMLKGLANKSKFWSKFRDDLVSSGARGIILIIAVGVGGGFWFWVLELLKKAL